MTDEAKALVDELLALYVWPQSVADNYADLLTPRQIEKLYEVGRVSHEAADLIETQAREIERLKGALGEICTDSNPDWTEKRVYPNEVLDDIHTIAVNAYYKVRTV